MMYFKNGPEYEARLKKPFSPPNMTLKEIHDAVPKHLLRKNQARATVYVLRDLVMASLLFRFSYAITPWAASDFGGFITNSTLKTILKTGMWLFYWWFQSLVNAGIFCLGINFFAPPLTHQKPDRETPIAFSGHDAGHSTLYENNKINNALGFVLHSYLLIPYFAWRSTHHAHHKATGSMERDENYVPYTRSKYNLPDEKHATAFDYEEVFEETPIYTLYRMFIMQVCGWWVYLTANTMGSPMYPPGTNHFQPSSSLFKPHQRMSIIMSNLGLAGMVFIFYLLGRDFFLWHYLVPYILVNHWIVLFTFLHHSDPTIPHYRKGAWSFLRGAAATVDRPLLGWMGRFFFHNISHDHVAHHFFLRAPFFNGPAITAAIKPVLGDSYNYDSTPVFYALYRSFTQCLFVENDGDIVFYKNKEGKAVREIAPEYLASLSLARSGSDLDASARRRWVPVEEQDCLDHGDQHGRYASGHFDDDPVRAKSL